MLHLLDENSGEAKSNLVLTDVCCQLRILILGCLNDDTHAHDYFLSLRFKQKIESWMKCMET